MVLIIIGWVILMFFLIKRESRRDALIRNSRAEQIAFEKSLLEPRRTWAIIGGLIIIVAVYMFLSCDAAIVCHYEDGILGKAHDTKQITWEGYGIYVVLIVGASLFLIGLRSYTKHDVKALKYQAMSDSDFEILRQKAYEEKMEEEREMKEIKTARRNAKIGSAIGSFLAGL